MSVTGSFEDKTLKLKDDNEFTVILFPEFLEFKTL